MARFAEIPEYAAVLGRDYYTMVGFSPIAVARPEPFGSSIARLSIIGLWLRQIPGM